MVKSTRAAFGQQGYTPQQRTVRVNNMTMVATAYNVVADWYKVARVYTGDGQCKVLGMALLRICVGSTAMEV